MADSGKQSFTKGGPIVFMFQPTHYEVVTGEKLKEWESMMRERVGLKAKGSFADGGTCCTSYCPDADDCDQD